MRTWSSKQLIFCEWSWNIFQVMSFEKLFTFKQQFSLGIPAQAIETWRKQWLRSEAKNSCALLPTLQDPGCSLGYPNFNSNPGSLWRQDFVSWLLLRSKESKTFDKPLLFVFSSQYGDVFSGLETEGLIWVNGRRKSSKQGGAPHSISHSPGPRGCCETDTQANWVLQLQGFGQNLKPQNSFLRVGGRCQKTVGV